MDSSSSSPATDREGAEENAGGKGCTLQKPACLPLPTVGGGVWLPALSTQVTGEWELPHQKQPLLSLTLVANQGETDHNSGKERDFREGLTVLPAKPGWFQPRTEYPAAKKEGDRLGAHGPHLPQTPPALGERATEPWSSKHSQTQRQVTPAFPEWGDDTRGCEAAEGRGM